MTFRELAERAAVQPAAGDGPIFPTGGGVGFVLEVLRGWRDGHVVVPLDGARPEMVCPPDVCEEMGIDHIKITSGSTGFPRQVLFKGSQLHADVENICATMGLAPELPNLGVISLAHSYGFSNLVLPLLLKGIPLVMAADALPQSVRRAISHARRCALPAVPAMWKAWSRAGILGGEIHLAISAGAPLPLELERDIFESTSLKVHNFYGSSECGGIAFDRTMVPRTDASWAGTAMDGVRVEVTQGGRLLVQGGAVAQGYWPKSPADGDGEAELGDGSFLASDLAEITGEGIRLLGRATEAINIAGRKLSPGEVEAALLTFPGTKVCVVFGVASSDSSRCEEVAAVVNMAGSLESLKQHVRSRLPAWQVPRHWWVCEDLCENNRGKISRREWRERFQSR